MDNPTRHIPYPYPSALQSPEQGGTQQVTEVTHWGDRLFSFRLTRPRSLRFRAGEFVMLGLPDGQGKPIMRAYSIASPTWDDGLEFYSIKVPHGPLTSRLQHVRLGDHVLLRPKAVGTLVHDALLPGKRLWMLATGTGIAPFASLLREPDTYALYDQVVVLHTCREAHELAYSARLIDGLAGDPLVGDEAAQKVIFYPTTTRGPSPRMGRITDTLSSGQAFADLGVPPLDPHVDRVMICGGLAFNTDVRRLLLSLGFQEGSNAAPGTFVLEKAFVGDGV